MSGLGKLGVVVFCALMQSSLATAAEISSTVSKLKGRDTAIISVTGMINKGDLSKLRSEWETLSKQIGPYGPFVARLQSPGGSYPEGVAMARFFSEKYIPTQVQRGAECMSACAVAFMGGSFNTESGRGILASRTIHSGGRVGFHAPFTQFDADKSFSGAQANRIFRIAVEAVRALTDLSEIAQIDTSLINDILAMKSDEFRELRSVDDFGRWHISPGQPAKPKAPTTVSEVYNICANGFAWYANGLVYSFPGSLKEPYTTSSKEIMAYYGQVEIKASHNGKSPRKYMLQSPWFGPDGLTCVIESLDSSGYNVVYHADGTFDPGQYGTHVHVPSWGIKHPDQNMH